MKQARGRSPDEVEAAIQDLSDADLLRIEKIARFRIRSLGRFGRQRSWEDLRQQAMLAIVSGRRTWPVDVDFIRCLDQAMRSIVRAWLEKEERRSEAGVEERSTSELSEAVQRLVSQRSSSVDGANSSAEEVLIEECRARGLLETLRSAFVGDRIVLEILAGFEQELTGVEIREIGGLPEPAYRAAIRRIRYHRKKQLEHVDAN